MNVTNASLKHWIHLCFIASAILYAVMEAGCLQNTAWVDLDGDGFSTLWDAQSDSPRNCSEGVDCDCDDNDLSSYPGAEELCDGKDHNCNGVPGRLPGSAEFVDADEDGFGVDRFAYHQSPAISDRGGSVPLCIDGNASTSFKRGDCNDSDAAVYPSHEDVSDDGIDSDCGGSDDAEPYIDEACDLNQACYTSLSLALESLGQADALIPVGAGQDTYRGFTIWVHGSPPHITENIVWSLDVPVQLKGVWGMLSGDLPTLNFDPGFGIELTASSSELVCTIGPYDREVFGTGTDEDCEYSILDGLGVQGHVQVEESAVVIRNAVFKDMDSTDSVNYNPVVRVPKLASASSVTLENVLIENQLGGCPSQDANCTASVSIDMAGDETDKLKNTLVCIGCIVTGNSQNTVTGFYLSDSEFLVLNSSFTNNDAAWNAGVYADNSSSGAIINTIIQGNLVSSAANLPTGIGLVVISGSRVLVSNSVSVGNSIEGGDSGDSIHTAALSRFGSTISLMNSVVAFNNREYSNGSIECAFPYQVSADDSSSSSRSPSPFPSSFQTQTPLPRISLTASDIFANACSEAELPLTSGELCVEVDSQGVTAACSHVTDLLTVDPQFVSLDDESSNDLSLNDVSLNLHLGLVASANPLVDRGTADCYVSPSLGDLNQYCYLIGTRDVDDSPLDIGAYSGPYGATWDKDFDGFPDYFWPGTYSDAPTGTNLARWDCDDEDPAVPSQRICE